MRSKTVIRVADSEQTHCHLAPSASRELDEETPHDIGPQTADPRLGQIDVGNDERSTGSLEHDMRQRLVRCRGSGAVPADALPAERLAQGLAERLARGGDLRLGPLGSDLQLEIERSVARKQA